DNNEALFVSEKEPYTRLTISGVEDILRRLGRKAGVEKVHPHRYRRTAATNALNRGMPLQEVSKMLGHAKTETTMIYCTINEESLRFNHNKYLSA
ncbi:tyrosine-type recombinase/integrase, partial [Robinsoniella sp. RHS]